jgi:hypothetical protein
LRKNVRKSGDLEKGKMVETNRSETLERKEGDRLAEELGRGGALTCNVQPGQIRKYANTVKNSKLPFPRPDFSPVQQDHHPK